MHAQLVPECADHKNSTIWGKICFFALSKVVFFAFDIYQFLSRIIHFLSLFQS